MIAPSGCALADGTAPPDPKCQVQATCLADASWNRLDRLSQGYGGLCAPTKALAANQSRLSCPASRRSFPVQNAVLPASDTAAERLPPGTRLTDTPTQADRNRLPKRSSPYVDTIVRGLVTMVAVALCTAAAAETILGWAAFLFGSG